MDGYVSKSQFAVIYGCSRAYVSQLVAAKRLVLSDDGKLVHVDSSLKLLNVTADPSKAGVKERWAAVREGRDPATVEIQPPLAAAPAAAAPGAAASADKQPAAAAPASSAYHDARTQREQAEAQMAQIELMERMRQIAEIEPIVRAMLDTHTAARTEVLGLADRLTQLVVAETDARKVYDTITRECERICDRMTRRIDTLRQQHSTTTVTA